ncbi:MAG: iron-containing alcohol dehydrogenase [Alphaproteobacteria bacterium]|nr:iron-containing alcohol dehydrogenase [Alphaproteobacteria bacterium]
MTGHRYYDRMRGGETAFTVAASAVKIGPGVLDELGEDARRLGMRRVALFVDPQVVRESFFAGALGSLKQAGLDAVVFSGVRVEPTDRSFAEAAAFARNGAFDGYVSIGGGSTIDTAKAANLLATHPESLLAYVNAPIGLGKPVPGPLRPHIACPTTAGTGSECTGVAIFDLIERKVKTGISSPFLKPTLAVVDPDTTAGLPAGVIASCGFDVLTHAIESYTARPYTSRERPQGARPPYQGANPWSDMGALQAIRLGARHLERAVADPADGEAREALMFAATLAGLAFGNAGVHIPHAMSYSVAALKHDWQAPGYAMKGAPHGVSVVVNAPAAFRFTAQAAPARHLEAADALGVDIVGAGPRDAGPLLADKLIAMMRATGMPSGIAALGYGEADIPALVAGAFAQQRLLVVAPHTVTESDLAALYRDSLAYW